MPLQVERVVRTVSSPEEGVAWYREADSQNFIVGDLLILDSNGRVASAAAAGNTYAGDSATELVGVALTNARNTTNPGQLSGQPEVRDVPVIPITANTRLVLPVAVAHTLGEATTANREASEYRDFQIGQTFQIRRITNGSSSRWQWVALINPSSGVHANPSNPVVVCVGKFPGIPDTEPFAVAEFAVLNAARVPG